MARLLELSKKDEKEIITTLLNKFLELTNDSDEKPIIRKVLASKKLYIALNNTLSRLVEEYSKRPFKTVQEALPAYPDHHHIKIPDSELDRILQEQAIRLGIRKPVNMSFKKSPSLRGDLKKSFKDRDAAYAKKLQQELDDFEIAKRLQQKFDDSQVIRKFKKMGTPAFARGKTLNKRRKSKPTKRRRKR